MINKILFIAAIFALNTAFSQVELLGAGATFPAPLITAMADEYRDVTDGMVVINYQSIGSGGGIRQFTEQTVMFGASEAFLNDEQLQAINAVSGEAFNLPITLGDVVITYNLPGSPQIVLDGDTIAEIYLGNITNWSDPQISILNPGVRIPPLPITVVNRSDGSGTTNIFTNYLTKVSPDWAERVGFATSVNWIIGIGGKGNEGVAGVVQNTPGAIGYNSLVYAELNDIDYAHVINSSGNVIEPSLSATTLAADVEIPEDTRILITNTSAPEGYPIVGFTWILLHRELDRNNAIQTVEQAMEVVRFLAWAFTDGQELSEPLSFARLPESVAQGNLERLARVTWQGELIGLKVLEELGIFARQ